MWGRSSPGFGLVALGLVFGTLAIPVTSAHAAPTSSVDDDSEPRIESGVRPSDPRGPPAASTTPAAPAPASSAAAGPSPLDDVIALRDGRQVRGRVVQKEPGRWVVIETEDGRRRMFAWDLIEEVDLARANRDVKMPEAVRKAWLARGGGIISYEVRAEFGGVALPARTFALTGSCSTGTGLAAASIYGQSASDRARGPGLGVGGRVSYMYNSALEPDRSSSWWGLRAGIGLDLQMLYLRAPVGLPKVNGELCTQVAKRSHTVESESTSGLLVQVPLSLGAHLALGKFDELTVWRGIVLGAAWAPSYIYAAPWTGGGGGALNVLGFELTVDFTTIHAIRPMRRQEAHFRIAAFFAPSFDDTQATMGTLGIGAVWY